MNVILIKTMIFWSFQDMETFAFEDGAAFTWRRQGSFIWRNKNEFEIATSERGQFQVLKQVGSNFMLKDSKTQIPVQSQI